MAAGCSEERVELTAWIPPASRLFTVTVVPPTCQHSPTPTPTPPPPPTSTPGQPPPVTPRIPVSNLPIPPQPSPAPAASHPLLLTPASPTNSSSSPLRCSSDSFDTVSTLVLSPPRDDSDSRTGPCCKSRTGMSSPTHESSFFHPSDSQSTLPTHNLHQISREGRPLIDLVTNEWASKSYRDSSFESTDSYSHAYFMSEKEGASGSLPSLIRQISFPRRVQRYLLGYAVFLLACWLTWLYYLQPAWAEERLYDASLAALNDKEQSFGANIRPEFTAMIHLKTLDVDLLPGSKSSKDEQRLIVVGDVHGCKDELSKLLDKVKFVKGKDHLILAGDMIAKGPDSRGVIDLAIALGADAVRGNWEDRTLLAYDSLVAKVHPLPGPQEDPNTKEDFLDEESFSHGDYKDRAMAKELDKKHIEWLQNCPVILKVGGISGFNGGSDIVVVHAGLAPGIDLDRQDPFLVMNMRSIDVMTRVPSEDRKGQSWEKLWNHQQSHTHPPSQRQTVIYGHDSKTGLNINKYSKGLDSGCVKGGELTAFIVDQTGKNKIVSVKCQKYK